MSRMTRLVPILVLLGDLSVTTSFADTVTISRDGCAALQRYVPAPDVNYTPGVDADGNAVAPADLDSGTPPLEMPSDITIAITSLLQQRFGIPADPNSYKPEAYIGTVTVKADGRAYFNDQPLQDDAAYELAQLCQKRGNAPPPPRPPNKH
jgi:hypothetical protein